MTMTKQEFKERWESNDHGGGITFNDMADCAEAWGLTPCARIRLIYTVRYEVLKAAGTVDAEDYRPWWKRRTTTALDMPAPSALNYANRKTK